MEQNKHLDDLLGRFLKKETTPEESDTIKKWLLQLDIPAEDLTEQDLSAIRSAMFKRIVSTPAGIEKRRGGVLRKMISGRAAVLVLLLGIAAAAYLYLRVRPYAEPAVSTIREENNNKEARYLLLKDGTKVWLNLGSSLVYQSDFNEKERRVQLKGEGYFDVAKDDHRPFIVTTDNIETRVLGTAFNVESYPDETEIRVSLVQGKVVVNDLKKPEAAITLSPDESMRYGKKEQRWEKLDLNEEHVIEWTRGSIVFNELPLGEALQRISQRFNIPIQYSPEIVADKRVTTVLRTMKWQSVLANILFVFHLKYVEKNGIITIEN